MRKCLFAFLLTHSLFLFIAKAIAQKENKVFEKAELDARTDSKAWTEHITRNSRLPDSLAKKIPRGIYKIPVRFVVDIHGNIGQIEAKNDPGYGLAQKAVNILRTYKGEWKPATQCGRSVKSYKEQPVVFVIEN